MNSYNLQINNVNYIVSGPGDRLNTPPSARGFTLKVFERGLNEYNTIFTANEENGYGFILYVDDSTKLILKGKKGDDHKVNILNTNDQLKNIRLVKYNNQDDMLFLRKTCLSGRTWIIKLQNIQYYFVAIWNVNITQDQWNVLESDYLSKFPKDKTYIQMGLLSSDTSSQFSLLSKFSPKIVSGIKLNKKEKEYVNTAHTKMSNLPASYAKELSRLKALTELTKCINESMSLKEGWKDWVAAGLIGTSALTGHSSDKNINTIHHTNNSQSFKDYIKTIENGNKVGFDKIKKLWFPHKSFEGGSDTIGYGHKIQNGENFNSGLTDTQINILLDKDLELAKDKVYKELGNIKLSSNQEEMFIDFVFNMGTLKKFPKFTQAVLKNDINTVKREFKRYSGGKELTGRNSAFQQRYLD